MTYQQIINRIHALYPHGEPIQTVIDHINSAQDALSPYFGKLVINVDLSTVSGQDAYTLPSGISDVAQIKFLDIGNQAVPTDRFDYTRYCYTEPEKGRPTGLSYYQIYSSTGDKTLGIYPIPTASGLPIRITYLRALTAVTQNNLTDSPEFDERYHDLIVYYGCHMVCASGASPDTIQADSFYQKFLEGVEDLWKTKMDKAVANPLKIRQNSCWER